MKRPFYKIGSIVKEGYLDPNRGKKLKDGTFGFYTDPTTKKKSTIEYEKGSLGRTYQDAFAKRDMKTYGGMDLKQYTDFSKKQKAHYRTTGVWLSPDKMKEYEAKDTSATNNPGPFVPTNNTPPPPSDNTPPNTPKDDPTKLKHISYKDFLKNKNNDPGNKNNDNEPIKFDKIDLSGGREAGLVRKFESQKGFSGDVLDKEIAKTTDAQSIRRYARGMKDKALSAGATRREAKHHKMLGKALGFAQDAGMTLKETDAKGGVVNESVGEKSKSIVGDGKARRKANRLMKRANRLAHRMKDYEGHNVRKGDVGGQYYGKGDVYNQAAGTGDGRNAQLRVGSPGAMNKVKSIVGKTNGNSNSDTSTQYGQQAVSEVDTSVVEVGGIGKKKRNKTE